MRFEVTILGNSSATPIYNRNPSAQILNVNDQLYLIDCGEATQVQLLRYGIRAQKINHIFISHLHGDHYLGLTGLLSSMHLNGRRKTLHIYGPPELEEILNLHFKHSQTLLRYPLHFHATHIRHSELIFENYDVQVETIILEHRIPCTGFKFTQKKRQRKIIKEKVTELNIPIEYISLIKRGIDYTDKTGQVFRAADLTTEAEVPRSYAYCSDTICSWTYLDTIQGVDTLYHEATFLHDMVDRAKETFHTTAREAAEIALRANVKQLLIGHFSARYKQLTPLIEEAQSIFPNTNLALEGKTFQL